MSSIQADPSNDHGGRAFRPGPRGVFLGAAVVALVAAGALVLALKPGGASPVTGRYPAQDRTYGSLPSWLPKSAREKPPAPKLQVATLKRPVLAEAEGYEVHAELPTGSVNVTASGPGVPTYVRNYASKGLWPASKLVPAGFEVTFSDVKGSIPISPVDFVSLTDTGVRSLSKLSRSGGGRVPSTLHSGQTLTLNVQTYVLAGSGGFSWAPTGNRVLVGWTYELELD